MPANYSCRDRQICAHSLTVEHPAYIRHMVPRLGSGPGSNPGGRTKYKYPRAAEARFREVPVGMADGVLKVSEKSWSSFFYRKDVLWVGIHLRKAVGLN